MMRRLILGLAASAMLGGAARAEPAAVARLGKLDLETAAGAATALSRIERAAKSFCGVRREGGVQVADAATLQCRREVTESTLRRLGAPNLLGLYAVAPERTPTGAPWPGARVRLCADVAGAAGSNCR